MQGSSLSQAPFKTRARQAVTCLAVLAVLAAIGLAGYYMGASQERARSLPVIQELREDEDNQSPAAAAAPAKLAPPSPRAVAGPGTPSNIADIAASVSPSVVNIDILSQVQFPAASFPDFGFFYNGSRIAPYGGTPARPRLLKTGTGSGVILRADGYVLTNHHVVRGTNRIKVTLADGRSFTGQIVGTDSASDLAVVKVPAGNLPPARLGTTADLRPGDWVIAIGSPLGLEQTVTVGIVSALGRSVADMSSEVGFIQTDAAINPGNSGGPLVNMKGQVVGINTFIRSDAQNIGFATPIETARLVADELIARGKVNRPWLGVKLATLTTAVNKRLGLPSDAAGVLVLAVIEGGPADKAGVKAGDVIQKIDGRPAASVRDVHRLVRARKPGEKVIVAVVRNDRLHNVSLTPGEMPEQID
jgi:S1-C subfamily serine protease